MNNKIFLILTLLLAVAFADTLSTINPGSATTVPYVFAAAGANANTYFSIPAGATVTSASLSMYGLLNGWATAVETTPDNAVGDYTAAPVPVKPIDVITAINGSILVAYYNQPTVNLHYAVFTPATATWEAQQVLAAPATPMGTSLAIAQCTNGTKFIAYYNDTPNELAVAWGGDTRTGANWNWENGYVSSAGGGYPSIIQNTNATAGVINGTIHIAFFNVTSGDLAHSWGGDGRAGTPAQRLLFNNETIEAAGNVGHFSSLKQRANGTLIVSYYDVGNTALRFAWGGDIYLAAGCVGGTIDCHVWNAQQVDNAAAVGQFTSMVVNSNGTLHIFYYDATNTAIKHAWGGDTCLVAGCVGGYVWNTETIDAGAAGDTFADISAFQNTEGTIHVFYRNITAAAGEELIHRWGTTASWANVLAVNAPGVTQAAQFARATQTNVTTSTLLGDIFALHYDLTYQDLNSTRVPANYPIPSLTFGSTLGYQTVTNLRGAGVIADFTSALNNYLATCTGNPCNVPIGVATTKAGTVNLANASIVYTVPGTPQIAQTGTGTGKKDTGKEAEKTGAETGKTEEEGQESGAGTGTSGTGATATTTTLWIIIGVIAVLIIGGAVFFLTKKK